MPTYDDGMDLIVRDDLRAWLEGWRAEREAAGARRDPVQEAVEQAVMAALDAGEIETAIAYRVVAKCRSIGRADVAAAVLLESREIDEMLTPQIRN